MRFSPLARGAAALTLAAAALLAPLAVRGAEPRLAAVGGLTALPAAESPSPNLLKNPGFELAADGAVTGWGIRAGGPWSLESGRSGGAALRMTGADRQQTVALLEQAVTLEPGLYTVEAWARTQALGERAPRSGARICLDARPRFNWWQ